MKNFIFVIQKFYQLLGPRDRAKTMLILLINLISAGLETIGVASILPFLTVATHPEVVFSQPTLARIYADLGFTDARTFLIFLGWVSLSSLVFSVGFRALATWAGLRYTYMLESNLSQRLLDLYLNQPYAWYLGRHSAGLSKMVLSEIGVVITGVVTPLLQLTSNVALAVALIGLTLAIEPVLMAWLIGVLLGAYVLSYWVSIRNLAKVAQDRFEANQERFHTTSEALAAFKELKAGGAEAAFIQAFQKSAHRYALKYVRAQVIAQTPRFVLEALVMGGVLLAVLLLISGGGNLTHLLPKLGLLAFAGYRLIPALQGIFGSFVNLRFQSPALHAVNHDFTNLRPSAGIQNISQLQGGPLQTIELGAVSYQYPGSNQTALADLSFRIPAGSTWGIVGKTGSGKTTLVDLLLGLLTPTKGFLAVNGVKIHEGNVRAWQEKVGYVPQQITLLDDSIARNIALGKAEEKIDPAAVRQAAELAKIHDFIDQELPDRYQTRLGERGIRLSGGQRQRIAIARALYRKPELLVFDEATSALDPLTEQALLEAIQNLHGKVTLVMVAHRLNTVRDCDQILVLEKGRIVAQGTHRDLSGKGNLFGGSQQNQSISLSETTPAKNYGSLPSGEASSITIKANG